MQVNGEMSSFPVDLPFLSKIVLKKIATISGECAYKCDKTKEKR